MANQQKGANRNQDMKKNSRLQDASINNVGTSSDMNQSNLQDQSTGQMQDSTTSAQRQSTSVNPTANQRPR